MNPQKSKEAIFAPGYYPAFHCIAEQCRHSCCIDWEICIDEKAMAAYRKIPAIRDTIITGEDGPCFALGADGRCPHLTPDGLCHIILTHGEAFLTDICRNHPRFINHVGEARVELGLGLVCEEACRLILGWDGSPAPIRLADAPGVSLPEPDPNGSLIGFDPLEHRDRILGIITDSDRSYGELADTLRVALDLGTPSSTDEGLERLLELEILDSAWAETLQTAMATPAKSHAGCTPDMNSAAKRLLGYFVYRHVSTAQSPDNLRARVAFSLFSVDIILALWERLGNGSPDALEDLARSYSAEIEYSEDNTAELIFDFECRI